LIFIPGCKNNNSLPPTEYAKWIENEKNGLKIKKTIGEYEFILQYKPVEYVVVMEEKNERLEKKTLDNRIEKLNGLQYFNLRLKSTDEKINVMNVNVKDDMDYNNKLNYFTFAMQQDVHLVEGNDTLNCSLFQFERNYELAPYVDFVMAFEKPKTKEGESDKQFVFDDKFLGIGAVKIVIDKNSVKNIPQLITY
jgi:hypothetical protein